LATAVSLLGLVGNGAMFAEENGSGIADPGEDG